MPRRNRKREVFELNLLKKENPQKIYEQEIETKVLLITYHLKN